MKLLIVESPGKIKKLKSILGPGWTVKASFGHIRELAQTSEDPFGFIFVGDNVRCHFVPRGDRGKKAIAELKSAAAKASEVYLATDGDREGETIGWHIQQALGLPNPHRVVYSEITAPAVNAAIANPRAIDVNLVASGLCRTVLDKLIGYKGSPLLWNLGIGAMSMRRVQSCVLHLLCCREREIVEFKPQTYWNVWVDYAEGFRAAYCREMSQLSNDAAQDDAEAEEPEEEAVRITSQADAERLVAIAQANPHQVVSVEDTEVSQSPPPAFTTSTLQQAAGNRLQFSPDKTMKVAQSLYEKGHITYMRTDSVALSESFCESVRQFLQAHDPDNLPAQTSNHRSGKGAQEAHEAIRPTAIDHQPEALSTALSADESVLYDLIWNRSIAALSAPARLRKLRVLIQAGETLWEARGQVVASVGYLRYWNNIREESQLPPLVQGQTVQLQQARAERKKTRPPSRYSEPKLVQLMEREGIGRPSTYASMIKILKDRKYVALKKKALHPTEMGMQVDVFLQQAFPDLVLSQFTAEMEAQLDLIAQGQQKWQPYLTGWNRQYFEPALAIAIQSTGNNK